MAGPRGSGRESAAMADITPPHIFQDVTLRVWWATRWRVEPGWRHSRPFRRPFTNVWYVLDGEMGVQLGQVVMEVGAGTLMVVPPGMTLDNWNAGEARLDYLSLGFEWILGGIDIYHGQEPEIRRVALSSETIDLWESLERETERVRGRNTLEANLRLAGYARLFWSALIEHIGAEAAQKVASIDPRVGRALEWMRANLHTQARLTDLAKVLYVSESYLRQLFISSLGVSFRRTLTDLRLQKAKLLLMTTSKPVGEISRTVGYTDPHHFAQVFARHEGASPSEYRRTARRNS